MLNKVFGMGFVVFGTTLICMTEMSEVTPAAQASCIIGFLILVFGLVAMRLDN